MHVLGWKKISDPDIQLKKLKKVKNKTKERRKEEMKIKVEFDEIESNQQ